jgi:hypothetical protein
MMTFVDNNDPVAADWQLPPADLLMGKNDNGNAQTSRSCLPLRGEGGGYQTCSEAPIQRLCRSECDVSLPASHRICKQGSMVTANRGENLPKAVGLMGE